MFATVVVAWILAWMTSSESGRAVVTHERTQVSALLSPLVADRRLLFITNRRIYMPRSQRSPAAVVVSLLLLLGGVESNPGPAFSDPPQRSTTVTPASTKALNMGLLNVCSARHKAAFIHVVIHDNRLDVLCMTETWIQSDAPDAVKLDVAPAGYDVVHQHRGSSKDKGGGGTALVHSQTIKAVPADVGVYTEFECLAVKLVGRRAR